MWACTIRLFAHAFVWWSVVLGHYPEWNHTIDANDIISDFATLCSRLIFHSDSSHPTIHVWMYEYIMGMYTNVRMYLCTYVCTYMHTCMYVCMLTFVCMPVRTYVHVNAYVLEMVER